MGYKVKRESFGLLSTITPPFSSFSDRGPNQKHLAHSFASYRLVKELTHIALVFLSVAIKE